MKLLELENELFSGSADTLLFNTLRKATVTLTLTDQRLIVGRLFASDAYSLDDITSVERFKAMFMNIGLKFNFKDGSSLSLATRHVNKFVEQLEKLGKM